VANLPAVSTTPVADFATNFASVIYTGGKFATGAVSFTPVANNGNKYQTAYSLK
jgi:hypothetical protein